MLPLKSCERRTLRLSQTTMFRFHRLFFENVWLHVGFLVVYGVLDKHKSFTIRKSGACSHMSPSMLVEFVHSSHIAAKLRWRPWYSTGWMQGMRLVSLLSEFGAICVPFWPRRCKAPLFDINSKLYCGLFTTINSTG